MKLQVNSHGNVVYQKHVRPRQPVTDYRTFVSGVRQEDIEGPHAESFWKVRKAVSKILKDRILVSHSVESDLEVRLDISRFGNPMFDQTKHFDVSHAGIAVESPKEEHSRHNILQPFERVSFLHIHVGDKDNKRNMARGPTR